MTCKLIYDRLSNGGICDDIWKSICIERWPHDIGFMHKVKGVEAGFWRRCYKNECRFESEGCGGVSNVVKRGFEGQLNGVFALSFVLFEVGSFDSYLYLSLSCTSLTCLAFIGMMYSSLHPIRSCAFQVLEKFI